MLFLTHKDEFFKNFVSLLTKVQNLLNLYIVKLRSDNKTKFKYCDFLDFCDQNRISYEFLSTRVPQQNRIVEKKNRIVQEATWTMINEYDLCMYFWVEVINASCYVMNCVFKTYLEQNLL